MRSAPVILRSGCKINLYLRVGPRRADGMHDLETFFLPLRQPADEIRLCPGPDGRLRVRFWDGDGRGLVDGPDAPDPDDNTLSKAWRLYADLTGFTPGFDLDVLKGVPQGAGLGGGSANAAALLGHMQALAVASGRAPVPEDQLVRHSAAVGADVPFFFSNVPCLATGVGERLTPAANPFAGCFLLLLCPARRIATAWAFAELDALRGGASALPEPAAGPESYVNDFERPVFGRYPDLAALHADLAATGPLLARMSGTGSCLFAVYADEKNARQAAKALASRVSSVYTHRLPG